MQPPLNIFIADDHPIFRRGLCEVIEGDPQMQLAGQAADGEEALRQIRELRPAVAVLDVQMPKLNGLQVARILAGESSAAKLILLTMHEDAELFYEAMDLGLRAYVLKESAAEDLLQAIRCVAEGRTFISPTISGLLLRRHDRGESLRQEKPGLNRLTPTEQRILNKIAHDSTSKEIADRMNISVRTVDTHRQNISAKLKLNGTHSLLKFAYDNKWLL
jgi:DNA-binding NarL/FixJ family response regulator